MTMIKTTALAAAFAAVALAGAPASAKGGGSDIAEQKKQLKQEIAAARANGGNDCAFASIFGMMFGHDGDAATASVPASTAAN